MYSIIGAGCKNKSLLLMCWGQRTMRGQEEMLSVGAFRELWDPTMSGRSWASWSFPGLQIPNWYITKDPLTGGFTEKFSLCFPVNHSSRPCNFYLHYISLEGGGTLRKIQTLTSSFRRWWKGIFCLGELGGVRSGFQGQRVEKPQPRML